MGNVIVVASLSLTRLEKHMWKGLMKKIFIALAMMLISSYLKRWARRI